MKLVPCLTFNGNAEEALQFYRGILSGETQIMRFSEMPADPKMPVSDAWANKVMHASLEIADGQAIYFFDVLEGDAVSFGEGVTIHIELDGEDSLRSTFAALSEGGKVTMPVDRMFWGAVYGSFVDQFGISWGCIIRFRSRRRKEIDWPLASRDDQGDVAWPPTKASARGAEAHDHLNRLAVCQCSIQRPSPLQRLNPNSSHKRRDIVVLPARS